MTTTAPYRIATDTRPEWKIRAKTHGPVKARTLTYTATTGTMPPVDIVGAHWKAATLLAQKINPEASVELHSGNRVSSMDWSVILP